MAGLPRAQAVRPARAPAPGAPGGEAPVAAPVLRPQLDLQGFRQGVAEAPSPAEGAPAAPASERLVIARAGRREIALAITADGMAGDVWGTPVRLTIGPTSISGRIGDDELVLHARGARGLQGSLGGRPLGFELQPTKAGAILAASLPEHGGRLELDPARLSFLPGCDRDLEARAPGIYEGRCEDGGRVRVVVPAGMARWPEVARLAVLAVLLVEPEAGERAEGIFPGGR
jgi:hypothetical protein